MKRLFTFILLLLPVIANAFTGKVEIDGIYYNLTTKANVAEVTYGDSPYSIDVITIPSTVEYEGVVCNVTSIGANAFQNCTALNHINIPSSVTEIGDAAFYGCTGLTDVVIPESVTIIGGSAYRNCTSLKTVSILGPITNMRTAFENNTSLESVYIKDLAAWCQIEFYMRRHNPLNYAKHFFVNEEEITDLVIPEGVSVVRNSFWGFQGLKTLTVPDGVTEIAACAFGNCENLTNVSIANTVKKIDYYAFRGCTALKRILIPNSVTYIGEEDFKGCTNLEEVVFGSSLNYLGPASFSNCTELKDVYVYTDKRPETYYDNTFSNSDINYATLHVKESLISSFKSDIPWKNFGTVVRVPEVIYNVDGEVYMKDIVMIGTTIAPITEPVKEGHTFSGWSEIPETMPKEDVTVTGTFTVNSYVLTYKVDDEVYKTEEVKYGSAITPEPEPSKTGYTFSGWSEIPANMPARDVTVNGSFTINKYKLKYIVDGEEYKSVEVEYNSAITPEAAPTKEGHTFSGWSEIPEKMPANDVTVTGSFTVNKYQVTYIIDGEIYATDNIEYASKITPPSVQEKEGYTFTWNEYPETMPSNDITITGTFAINSYILSYYVDGVEYKTIELEYNTSIIPEEEPIKEGYSFSGWSEIPETMPAHDLIINGSFIVNKYKVTYIIDGEVLKTDYVEYGATIVPPTVEDKEGYTFTGWTDVPETMPAHDITIYGSFTSGIEEIKISDMAGVKIYTIDGKRIGKLQRGINILREVDGKVRKVRVK